MDYRISNIETEDGRTADGVYENSDGAWLCEYDFPSGQMMPLTDEDGDYIPVPDNWRELVIEQVV